MTMFVIEDERHAERQGEFASLSAAMDELRRLERVPYGQAPNVAPCAGRRTCGRYYEIVEYDAAAAPWKELHRMPTLTVDAVCASWSAWMTSAVEDELA